MYNEGKAVISSQRNAFLNPDGKVSRDISAAYVAIAAGSKANLIDTTAATGIRAIRYYLESGVRNITALEINRKAFTSMRANLKKNKVKASALNQSIQEFANTSQEKFDFIDLDPFGGVSPYVYDLMKISKDGTEFMATATDTAVLCGADSKACMRLYDSKPMHNELSHESGLRLLIGYIARNAAQFNMGIEVRYSLSYLHYMRAFIRLNHGSESALRSISELGYVQYCEHCNYRKTDKSFVVKGNRCDSCGKEMGTYGRIWLGRIKDRSTSSEIKSRLGSDPESKKSYKLSDMIDNELDSCFYYSIPKLTQKLGVGAISPALVMSELNKIGYKASGTHMQGSSVKTDAEFSDVVRCTKEAAKRHHKL